MRDPAEANTCATSREDENRLNAPITIAGTTYRVLRLDGVRGPRYLLRSPAGDLIGLFPRGAEPMRLYAAPLVVASGSSSPFGKLDFLDVDGRLSVADGQKSAR